MESFYGYKIFLLKAFGAKIGKELVIKNNVCIKFPWKLTIGNDVCISQGALLLTGNHDYTLSTFDYRNAPIVIDDGVWIGAKTVVCSVATKDMEEYGIYQGNPARIVRKRNIK